MGVGSSSVWNPISTLYWLDTFWIESPESSICISYIFLSELVIDLKEMLLLSFSGKIGNDGLVPILASLSGENGR